MGEEHRTQHRDGRSRGGSAHSDPHDDCQSAEGRTSRRAFTTEHLAAQVREWLTDAGSQNVVVFPNDAVQIPADLDVLVVPQLHPELGARAGSATRVIEPHRHSCWVSTLAAAPAIATMASTMRVHTRSCGRSESRGRRGHAATRDYPKLITLPGRVTEY